MGDVKLPGEIWDVQVVYYGQCIMCRWDMVRDGNGEFIPWNNYMPCWRVWSVSKLFFEPHSMMSATRCGTDVFIPAAMYSGDWGNNVNPGGCWM